MKSKREGKGVGEGAVGRGQEEVGRVGVRIGMKWEENKQILSFAACNQQEQHRA